jgi:hypothetical protein
MSVKLLTPTYEKESIDKAHFADLPAYLQPHIAGLDHIWKVTITPQKAAGSGLCRVVTEAPYNFGSGPIVLQNLGRIPVGTPAPTVDDLRPTAYYVWGKGSQRFRVALRQNNGVYADVTVTFE